MINKINFFSQSLYKAFKIYIVYYTLNYSSLKVCFLSAHEKNMCEDVLLILTVLLKSHLIYEIKILIYLKNLQLTHLKYC